MKDQGQQSDEQLREMVTAENFEKYKEVVRASVIKNLQLGMIISEIAQKEGLKVNPLEIEDQFELVKTQAKGEEFDEAAVRDRIEATLEKERVLEWIASKSTINIKEA